MKVGRWGHASDAPLHINSVLELMKRAIARAGIETDGFSTHSLRRGFANHAINRNTDVRDLMDWVKWKDIRSAVAYLEANQRLANSLAEIDQEMPPTVSVLEPVRLRSADRGAPIVAAPFSDRVLILNVRIEKNNGTVPDRAVQLIRRDIEWGVLAELKFEKKNGAEYHFMSPVDLDSAEFVEWAKDLIHEIVETVDEAACWCEPELWRSADQQEYGREWMGSSTGWAARDDSE